MANNETLIPIPGRLHSVATEGHVAGADEIIDDTLNKDQATLNSESAYIDDSESSSAVIPEFDPESQTVHVTAQTLSEQQKAQARANIDLNDLVKYSEQTLTTAQKDQVAANLNNKNATNGMARIELKATDNFKSVVEAQTDGNTIFVIKYDFTLTGNVTIPANCVLEFDGGSISGAYTLTGQNTDIIAPSVKIIDTNITLAGTWKCVFNLCWFGVSPNNEDNGPIINNLNLPTGHCAIIPEGNYDFKTPVELPYFKSFTFYGNLIYKGTQTNVAFIKMSGFGTYNFLGAVYCESPSINYTDANNSNIIGINVYNAKCSKFTIANIYGFNENLRISAIGNLGEGGSAWNTWYILENREANKHIRIWQEDVDGHMGWVNGQYFYLQRMAVSSDVYNVGTVSLYYINDGYPAGHIATNLCDNLFFNLSIAEVGDYSHCVPIHIRNSQYVRFTNVRHEGAYDKWAKIVGDCYNLKFDVSFGKCENSASYNWFDLSECNTQPFDTDYLVKNFAGDISLINKEIVDGKITSEWYGYLTVRDSPTNLIPAHIDSNNDIVFDRDSYGSDQTIPCMFIDSSKHKLFLLENMQSEVAGDVWISYARNSNGDLITKDGNDSYSNDKVKVGERYLGSGYSPSSSAGTHFISDNPYWKITRRVSFRIPDDITGFYITISHGFNRFRLYSLALHPGQQFEPKVLKRLV